MRKAVVITSSLAVAAILGGLIALPGAQPARAESVEIRFGAQVLKAEIAATPIARQIGLMNRSALPENLGMLFVFPADTPVCMWMKDTLIPLSVAFIDRDGRVLNIADMQPGSLQIHCATAPVRYALEANQGWFQRRAVKPGDTATGMDDLDAR